MESNNKEKSRHGNNAQMSLEDILIQCKELGYISKYIKNFRIGKDGYENNSQFYSPFLIVFRTNEKWAVFSTTSMRTDRIKGQQWDATNLKQIDPTITTAVLVYSDDLESKEKTEFERQHAKYISGYEYSTIDAIITQSQLYLAIENNALQDCTSGQMKDIRGRAFEQRLADTLSNKNNLKKWKRNCKTDIGMYYELFEYVVQKLGLVPEEVEAINASSGKETIKKLPSGGLPKTDVFVVVLFSNGERECFSISCKCTTEDSVSVHQYTADSFADVLDPNNDKLRCLLNQFQTAGSLSAMGDESVSLLEAELAPYKEKLALWVLGGIGGDGNPLIQWATHLITYNSDLNHASMYSIKEYCSRLEAKKVRGNFGTYFQWTYPSKRRGKSIQLKCKIV